MLSSDLKFCATLIVHATVYKISLSLSVKYERIKSLTWNFEYGTLVREINFSNWLKTLDGGRHLDLWWCWDFNSVVLTNRKCEIFVLSCLGMKNYFLSFCGPINKEKFHNLLVHFDLNREEDDTWIDLLQAFMHSTFSVPPLPLLVPILQSFPIIKVFIYNL